MQKIILYTDGGCKNNPGGIGGWAVVGYQEGEGKEKSFELSGSMFDTTNNRMELQAVIEGLSVLPKKFPGLFDVTTVNVSTVKVCLYTDSQYVRNGITNWIHNWKRNNWRTSTKKHVKNKELWQELERQTLMFPAHIHLEWSWVKGHSGNYYNERCDQLVKQNFIN